MGTVPACLTTTDLDGYFSSGQRAAAWAALTTEEKDAAAAEACRWLQTLCFDEDADCCGKDFETAWLMASAELALWLHSNPSAIFDAGPSNVFTKREKLGDLEVEYERIASARVTAQAPFILQRAPWLLDMLSCWLNISTGGSRILSRC